MSGGNKCDTKIRVLLVAKMLNEGGMLSASNIASRLEAGYGIKADRKTIMSDVRAIDRVLPLQSACGRNGGYKKYNILDALQERGSRGIGGAG